MCVNVQRRLGPGASKDQRAIGRSQLRREELEEVLLRRGAAVAQPHLSERVQNRAVLEGQGFVQREQGAAVRRLRHRVEERGERLGELLGLPLGAGAGGQVEAHSSVAELPPHGVWGPAASAPVLDPAAHHERPSSIEQVVEAGARAVGIGVHLRHVAAAERRVGRAAQARQEQHERRAGAHAEPGPAD